MKLDEIFKETTYVKPAPGSSSFFRKNVENSIVGAVQEFKKTNELGEEVTDSSSPYSEERFNGTQQVMGLRWNYSKRKWMITDPLDITKSRALEDNSDTIDFLVKESRLVNEKPNHPDFGKFIDKADIFDRQDPFFTHTKTRKGLSAGEAFLPTSLRYPINVIVMLGWLARKDFHLGSAISTARRGTQVKYIIVDNDVERKHKQDERKKDKQARKFYDSLDATKKLKLAMALGIVTNIETAADIIDDYIYDYATDTKSKPKGGMKVKQDLFLEMLNAGKKAINAHYVFYLGKSKGIIRMQNKTYVALGKTLGPTVAACAEVLQSEGNTIYEDILQACEVKDI